MLIEEFSELNVCIVVGAIASAEDVFNTSLQIFSIGRSRQHVGTGLMARIIDLVRGFAAHTVLEGFLP